MPKTIETKIGDVYQVQTVKTGWDKFVDFVKELIVGMVCLFVLSAIVVGIFS
jgi:hypothetical protein